MYKICKNAGFVHIEEFKIITATLLIYRGIFSNCAAMLKSKWSRPTQNLYQSSKLINSESSTSPKTYPGLTTWIQFFWTPSIRWVFCIGSFILWVPHASTKFTNLLFSQSSTTVWVSGTVTQHYIQINLNLHRTLPQTSLQNSGIRPMIIVWDFWIANQSHETETLPLIVTGRSIMLPSLFYTPPMFSPVS